MNTFKLKSCRSYFANHPEMLLVSLQMALEDSSKVSAQLLLEGVSIEKQQRHRAEELALPFAVLLLELDGLVRSLELRQ